MARLFNKLNTLLRASIEGFLEDDLRLSRGHRDTPRGKALDREIEALRREISAALDYEDDLQTRIDALRQDASDLDLQADNALLTHQQEVARQALAQLKRTEQQIAMLEADLAQHRQHVAALMDRVNVLEGLAAEATARQRAAPADSANVEPAPAEQTSSPVAVQVTASGPGETAETSSAGLPPSPVTDEELAARRRRLTGGTNQKE
ncbi:MAG: hypothetical protein HPY64_10160 [Anaerolineae bacterium]|nr:hypothetical protein [Anaerolineae bacterium]